MLKPQDDTLLEEYNAGWKITDVFPVNVLGFQSHRDHFAVDYTKATIKFRVAALKENTEILSDADIIERFQVAENRDWKIPKIRKKIRDSQDWEKPIIKCAYRPFDFRYCYFDDTVMDYPRKELIRHVAFANPKNLVLNVTRQTKSETWQHAIVSNMPTPAVFVEIKDGSNVFPLYLYPSEQEAAMGFERAINISPAFLGALQERLGVDHDPEAIFHYAYAVFHAPIYRQRYAAFLKIDFPRLPLPPDRAAFETLAALGAKLVALHLLEAPGLNRHGISYPVGGDHHVQKLRAADRYLPPSALALEDDTGILTGRVRLNEKEYFENVPPESWEFRVGEYQPAYKWLDDRVDRFLTDDDIVHYMRMLAAMRDTAALLPQVDAAFKAILPAATEE